MTDYTPTTDAKTDDAQFHYCSDCGEIWQGAGMCPNESSAAKEGEEA